MMKRITLILVLALTGCASNQAKESCATQSCERPLSNEAELVVWWGPEMRSGLEQGKETTRYALIP